MASSKNKQGKGGGSQEELTTLLATLAPQMADYLRLGTLLMPDGGSTELTSEAVHTGVSIISLFADVVTSRRGALARHRVVAKGGIAPSCAIEVWLEAAKRIELLVEMAAERTPGKRMKFALLTSLELFKALCRIWLATRGLDLDQRGRSTGLALAGAFKVSRNVRSDPRLRWWILGTTVQALRPVIYLAAVRAFGERSWIPLAISLFLDLLSEALSTFAQPQAGARRTGAEGGAHASGDASKDDGQPGGGGASQAEDEHAHAEGNLGSSTAAGGPAACGESATETGLAPVRRAGWQWEQDELQRRRGLLLLYFLRPPLFTVLVRPLIEFLRRILARIPVIGSICCVVLDMIHSLGRYYFYSAGS
mmetsp:Transcript_39032/g.96052  ORF Transcript_39032/g.96052 Transcript_39032/m.96052 type:complete len:365 (+) Transcript_39032:128-1222(+)